MAADPKSDWLAEHQDDAVMVSMIDLMRLVARLGQVAERLGKTVDTRVAWRQEQAIRALCETDLPALEAVLPLEALEIVAEEIR
jgi:hypothetical protein